jgi:hypothetical protein
LIFSVLGTPRSVRKYKLNTYMDEKAVQSNLSFGLKFT